MKFAYLLYGIRIKTLFKLVRKHGFSLNPCYIFRFLFLLQNAIWSSTFAITEKLKYKNVINSTELPTDPVIIIGCWRTGSTFLHQLLQLDDNTTTLSHFHAIMPDSFLVSVKYYKPVMKFLMGRKPMRPFDNVSLAVDEPQEDEFALLKMCGQSPLINLIYPKSKKFFLLDYNDFDLHGNDFKEWKEVMTELYKKIKITSPKRIIIKNPFHSQRIITLRKLFPDAKFIHIYRNPDNVIPSMINMWNKVGRQNIMKPGFVKATVQCAAEVYDRMLTYIQKHTAELPGDSFHEIKYENLEKNPVEEIKNAYNKLGLPFTKEFEDAIRKRLSEKYYKNKYSLTEEDKIYIKEKLKHHLDYYEYS